MPNTPEVLPHLILMAAHYGGFDFAIPTAQMRKVRLMKIKDHSKMNCDAMKASQAYADKIQGQAPHH